MTSMDLPTMDREGYDEALEAGGVGIWRWEAARDGVRFSANVAAITGAAPSVFAAALEPWLREVVRPDGPSGCERRHRVEAEEPRWIRLRGRVRRDALGNAISASGTLEDIGELVALEEAERASSAQLGAFMDAVPGVALVLGEDGAYVDLFTGDEQLLPLSREAHLGKRMHDVLPVEAADLCLERVQEVLASETLMCLDYRLQSQLGELWFEGRIAPVRGGWRGRAAVLWIAIDITERRRAEQALRASEERYRTVVELLAEGVMVIHPAGTILASNPSSARILGFTSGALVGASTDVDGWSIVDRSGGALAPEDLPLRRALRGEHCVGELIGVQGPDATSGRRWLSLSARPFRTLAGDRAALVSFVDVTDERRAVEALTESEWQLRSVIDNAEVMLWRFDVEGRVAFAGGRLLGKLGYLPGEVMGQRLADAVRDPGIRADVLRALHGEEVRAEREVRGVTLELVHAPVRDGNGALSGVISVGVDVSERIRASLERERFVAELEAKNAELERFNYTVSHDLKSPLITIQGFVELLEKDLVADRPERVARDLEHIARATGRMQRLLDDLLELSRAGRMQRFERVELGVIVDEALAQLEGALRGKGISLVVKEALPEVYADRTRVLQVVQNLVDNAVKHLGEQPSPRIEIGEREDGAVCVRDNGRGIPERHHEVIFGLFERLDPTVPGTGVGLALARRIIEAHGGRIWVESTGVPGEGSTFCFTLPRAAEDPPG